VRLQVRVLHFVDGIGALGGTQTVSRGVVSGGPRPAEDIQRVAGGYLVKWNGSGGRPGLYFVPDARIACAQVEDLDASAPVTLTAEDQAEVERILSREQPPAADDAAVPPPPAGSGGDGGAPPASVAAQPASDAPAAEQPAPVLTGPLPEGVELGPGGVYRRSQPTPPVRVGEGELPDPEAEAVPYRPSRRRSGPQPAKAQD
jgi:hypothetical protein